MSLVHLSAATVRRRVRPVAGLALAVVATSALVACAPDTVGTGRGGESRLKPRFQVADPPGRDRVARAGRDRERQLGTPGRARASAPPATPAQQGTGAPAPAGTPTGRSSGAPSTPPSTPPPGRQASAGPPRADLTDPRGDTSGGLGTPPAHVDLTGASVTRWKRGFEVRIDVAGALPTRQQGSQVQNVAAFFDLDGDALVDYETWGTLSDSGWSGSHRTPDSARFGPGSGVGVRPDGATLVLTFPLSHLEGARTFRWQVGSEWGTYEQIASGTTASDRAGGGGAGFPS